jgi:hypothetical protein
MGGNMLGLVKKSRLDSVVSKLDYAVSKICMLKNENEDIWFSNGLLNDAVLKLSNENKILQTKLNDFMFVLDIMQYLLENKEDIRMEELVLNLIEQLADNPDWVLEFYGN